MSSPINKSSQIENLPPETPELEPKSSPNYGKAAVYIVIATIAAVIFAGLIVSSGGGVIVAGFMFSIGLAVDGAAILAGTGIIALFAGFAGYETCKYSFKANKILNPPGVPSYT